MDRKAGPFTDDQMKLQTFLAKRRVEDVLKRAKQIEEDSDKENRLKRQLCKGCHYAGARLAGQAFTYRPCACCLTTQTYSSTYTDELCMPCAQEGSLCKHCAGDLEMNTGRTDWPQAKAVSDPNAMAPDT